MKQLAGIVILIVFGLGASGCLDVETTTQVHPDGSLTRTISMKGDSARVYRGDYPLTVDSSWKSSIRKAEEKKYEFSASKTFSDARSLNEGIAALPLKTLPLSVEFERTFWWFVTDYRYTETYRRWCPFDNVPLTDYVSLAELEAAIKHELNEKKFSSTGDSLALHDFAERFEEWDARNIFEAYFAAFVAGAKELSNPSLPVQSILSRKGDLLKASLAPIQQSSFDTLDVLFAKILRTRLVPAIRSVNSSGFGELTQQLEFRGSITANTYSSNVAMPGIITETNARSIEGNTAKFSDFIQIAYFTDFEMRVTSRAVNWWAIVLTAALLVVGGILLIAGKRRAT